MDLTVQRVKARLSQADTTIDVRTGGILSR